MKYRFTRKLLKGLIRVKSDGQVAVSVHEGGCKFSSQNPLLGYTLYVGKHCLKP